MEYYSSMMEKDAMNKRQFQIQVKNYRYGAYLGPLVRKILGALSFGFILALGAGSNNYKVSPSGNSLHQALDWIEQKVPTMMGDLTVTVEEGVYYLDSSLIFNSLHNPKNNHRIVIKAAKNAKPLISGGFAIKDWVLHDTLKRVWKASVPKDICIRNLYLDKKHAIRARLPNLENARDMGPYYKTVDANKELRSIQISKTQFSPWQNLSELELVIQPHWYHNRMRIQDFEIKNDLASLSIKDEGFGFSKKVSYYQKASFHFENSLDFLDWKNEWFHDKTTNTLYLVLPKNANPNELTPIAGKLDYIIRMEGTADTPFSGLELEGLSFAHTTWSFACTSGVECTQAARPRPLGEHYPPSAIYAEYAQGISITKNHFYATGANGIDFHKGVRLSQINRNTMMQIGMNGIVIHSRASYSVPSSDRCNSIHISDNSIQQMGRIVTNGIGVVAYFTNDVIIEHNHIQDGPYMGIQVGGQTSGKDADMGNNLIRFNHIHHVMQLHDDGGGIYTLGKQPGTHIYQNYIHDVKRNSKWAKGFPVGGVYLDNYSEAIKVEDNVIRNATKKTYVQKTIGAKGNTILNTQASNEEIQKKAGVREDETPTAVELFKPDPKNPFKLKFYNLLGQKEIKSFAR